MLMKSKACHVSVLLALLCVLALSVFPARALAAGTYGVVQEEDGWYLEDKTTGKKVTGLRGKSEVPEDSGNYYWFINTKGQVYRKAWIRSAGKTYRTGGDGKLYSGRRKVGRKYYYFKPASREMAVNYWKKVSGGYTRYGSDGGQLFGFAGVKNHTYYFNPNNKGIRETGLQKISGKTYCFDDRGRMQKGFVKVGGRTCYFAANGTMVTGWLTLDEKKYYFNKKTGAMTTGKATIDGKTYNFGTKGYISADPGDIAGAWSIYVNKTTCVVTIYKGSTPVKAMLCSPGALESYTPVGTYSLGGQLTNWHPLFGNVWGQYCRTITGNILFHSVYYTSYRNVHTLATGEYVKLGSPASHGCVRLSAGDAYYIWTRIPAGTKVTIGHRSTDPLPRPSLTPLNGKNYDPTDPNLND